MTHRNTRLALAALAALSSSVVSVHAAEQIDPVVVTATREPQKLSEVIADLTVITREQIESQGFGGVADLLRNTGAVEMTRNGTPASTTSLFIRGAETRHTVVLIDGVRVDSQSTGGASWNGIPLSQIDHIEILKGPASAIYGSDAVGGVVQIFTRKGVAGKTQLDLGIGAGNLGTRRADASISGGNGMFDYAVSLAGERSDGFNATTPANTFSYLPDRDGWRSHSGSLRLGAQLNAQHRVELTALKSHVDGQYDDSTFTPDADDHSIQDTRATGLSWKAQWLPALQTQLSVGESKEHYETKPDAYVTDTRVRTVSLNGSYMLAAGQQVTVLAERREDLLDNTGLVTAGVGKRHENALALGYLLHTGPLNVQAFARRDDDSQFGGVNTGTLMAGYEFAPGLRVVASAGNSFRAPTLYQIGTVYGPDLSLPGVQPLNAERGHNVEIGLKYNVGDNEFSATAYRNRVNDLIVFGAAGTCQSTFGCYQNVAQARLQGLSLAAGTKLGIVNLGATLDLQAPKNTATGLILQRRAKTFGTLRADTTLADWTFGGNVQFSGQRYNDAANKQALGGYALLNLEAAYKIRRDLSLQLNVDNAADKPYSTATGYASAPRTVFIGLRYTPTL
ncbi:TonB-dependent receptor [Paucibacter sp. R3-3]|uniref:TonB-dependent receptor n=1 Tax=Roseateles agri TaxID=3098619 RepID=A0ABU5DP83_9BURK|nr:TonB-dependent receptor [Paucibacter sp. R3-3]MDY0747909.1 TonB-dependent receptor [Paucibacter sp. R3-3]